MSNEPVLSDHEARIKLLEVKVEALVSLLEKEDLLLRDDVEGQVKEILDRRP